MTPIHPNGIGQLLTRQHHFHFSDFDVSWAGENPWNQGYCFGSEDGRLLFTGVECADPRPTKKSIVESGEAINGVASLGRLLAVSTRSEVVFLDNPRPGDGRSTRASYGGGAHGVIATPTGKFVAPLGTNGFFLTAPQPGEFQPIKTSRVPDQTFDFYKMVYSGVNEVRDVLTCALRRGGWGTVVGVSSSGSLNVFSTPGLDVVDVCSIGTESSPYAVVALGIDRSLHMIRNVLAPSQGSTLRIDGLRGVAYRVMCACGHLIVLTSESLYLVPDLVNRFLGGDPVRGTNTAVCIDNLQAVDAFLAYDRRLLIVMPDGGVSLLDIDELAALRGSTSSPVATQTNLPVWEEHPVFDLAFVDASPTG